MKLLIILSVVVLLTEASFLYKPIIRQCPSGWTRNGGQCYFFCHSLVNQNTAAVSCKAKGGYLVRIDNAAEDEFLKRQTNYLKIATNYWISPVCRRQKYEYKCTWQHESNNLPIRYEGWSSGEPNSQQACAVLYCGYGWKWNDYNCYNTAHYICEKPGLVVLPAGSSSSGSSSDSSGRSSDSSGSSSDSSGSSSDSSGSKSGSKSKKKKGKKYYKNKSSSSSSSSSDSSNSKGHKYGKRNSGLGSGGKSKGGKSKGGKSKGSKSHGKKHHKNKKYYKAGSHSK